MKNYECVAFDLDGTISDPAEGLVTGFAYAFKKMGVNFPGRDYLRKFIGPPLFECWQREFGFTPEQADRAIELFREYYTIYGWRENKMYEGIPRVLKSLKKAGKKLIVATSKPEDQARKIIKLHGLDEYFDFVGGAISHRERATKEQVLKYAMKQVGVTDSQKCVLVGDRRFDAEGAKLCGVDSIGVLYGHGSREEIENSDFCYIAQTVYDIEKIIIHS